MNVTNPPVSIDRLEKIAEAACDSALSSASTYVHSDVESWNNSIINNMLENMISSASSTSDSVTSTPQYKYAVNSTIIQHLSSTTATHQPTQTASPPSSPGRASALGANEADARDGDGPVLGTTGDERSKGHISNPVGSAGSSNGKRGMHSATGAYWNNEMDGMWNFKYEAGESKGMDVVISVIWTKPCR